MLKTPEEKHMEMLERELARHALGEGTGQGSGEAFRRGLEAMPRIQALFRVDPRIDSAGESAELTLAPGVIADVTKGGAWILRVDEEVREFDSLDRLLFDDEVRRAIADRVEQVPYLEVRAFGKWVENLDEIVATQADVSVKRTGPREFIIQVNEDLFRMDTPDSERGKDAAQGSARVGDPESHGQRMIFLCTDREGYGPAEDAGKVQHYPERNTPETRKEDIDYTDTERLERVEARRSHLHIEQMSTWHFWAGIGQGSYSFVMDPDGGAGIRIRRVHPSEAADLPATGAESAE